jgi:hypothetical protein
MLSRTLTHTLFVLLASLFISAQANATCLTIHQQSGYSTWYNSCQYPVTVNWTDQGSCNGWRCTVTVGPRQYQTALLKGSVRWCECRGHCYPQCN